MQPHRNGYDLVDVSARRIERRVSKSARDDARTRSRSFVVKGVLVGNPEVGRSLVIVARDRNGATRTSPVERILRVVGSDAVYLETMNSVYIIDAT